MANVDTVIAAQETQDVAVAQPEIAVVVESVENEMKMETASCETQPALIAYAETKESEASEHVANDSNDGNAVSIEIATLPDLCGTEAGPNNTPVKPAVEAAESEPMAEETFGKVSEKSDTEEAEMKNPETDGEAIECEGKTTADEPAGDATASVGVDSATAASTAAA